MKQILLDTHTWVWSFAAETELSKYASEVIATADAVFVSPISFYEVGQKVRLGKWHEMNELIGSLPDILKEQGGLPAPFTPEICLHASLRDWTHRDPFDRFLASTAELMNVPLISKDTIFDTLPLFNRIWLK